MKIFRAFLIKCIFVALVTFSIYSIFQPVSFGRLLLITLIVSTVTFIGDLLILPRMNQALAVVSDFIGLFALYIILGNILFDHSIPVILPAFASAFFLAACEAIFHMFMMEYVHEEARANMAVGSLQMEVSEEFNSDEKATLKKSKRKD